MMLRVAMEHLNLIQWPAMIVSIVAAWLVASRSRRKRHHGFWWFLASNVLWIAWGWQAQAWALVGMQVALGLMNVRGVQKNDTPS